MKLLIVDDHPGVRQLIRLLAVRPGDSVRECCSADEAVQAAAEFAPDFVTMDIRMPGLCSFEATRVLHATHPGMRIVIVTSYDHPEMRAAACAAGAHAFLAKDRLSDLPQLIVRESAPLAAESTQARSMDESLRHAQKLQALGTLAGGVAHDFNNVLGAILAYADLARQDAPAEGNISEYLDQVIRGCHRAKELIQRILSFSRQQPAQRKAIRLQAVLQEALELLRCTLPANVEMVTELDPTVGWVLADATQIHQVLINLGSNAGHAMKHRAGRLEVRLETCLVVSSPATDQLGLLPGAYACLTVADQGHGMDEVTRERIFDPFFTTKSHQEGTGLGLAVVQSIVQEHQGIIQVDTRVGQGTTFRIYFPLCSDQPQLEGLGIPERPWPPGSGERILFVDDETALCGVAQALLSRLNYAVTTCVNPREALAHFREHPEAFDLVVTDLQMPGMSGVDLARELIRIRPRLPVLLTSGYAGIWTREELQRLGVMELLPKPLCPAQLAEWVQRALQGAGSPDPNSKPSQPRSL